MNIQKRISSIEKAIDNKGFCNCKGTSKEEMFLQDLTSDSGSNEIKRLGESIPDYCPKCKKGIYKETLTIILEDNEK